jgi:hypothetical protein
MAKYFFILLMLPTLIFGQKNKLNGNVKSTREKIVFLNDTIQNYKFLTTDDYGHSGFTTSQGTINRFTINWYNSAFVHYINNRRIYNKKGLIISEDWFYKNGKKITTFNYTYTKFDSLKKVTDERVPENFIISHYDFDHNVVSKMYNFQDVEDEEDDDFDLILYSYENSKKTKESIYTKDGESLVTFFNYNSQNLLNKITVHKPSVWTKYDEKSYQEKPDSVGTFYIKNLRFYNIKKELIREEKYSQPEYNRKSALSEIKYFIYDESGNCIEEKTTFGLGGIAYINSKKFDSKNRIIDATSTTSNGMNPWDESIQYIYNDKDELATLFVTLNKIKYKVDFTYKYDRWNNWIEQTKSIDGKKLFVWKRKIKYY